MKLTNDSSSSIPWNTEPSASNQRSLTKKERKKLEKVAKKLGLPQEKDLPKKVHKISATAPQKVVEQVSKVLFHRVVVGGWLTKETLSKKEKPMD